MNTTRRALIKTGFGVAVFAGAPTLVKAAFADTQAPKIAHFPVGVQLWSVHPQMAKDVSRTLHAIRDIGYTRVEVAGLFNLTPSAFHKALIQANLDCPSAHVPMSDLVKDPDGSVSQVRDLGAHYLICPAPRPDKPLPAHTGWISAMHQAMTLDAWTRTADQLNKVAQKAKVAGLRTGYHNHPFDFAKYDGVVGWELLVKRTDPSLVTFELDCAWAAAGGRNPAKLIRNYAKRISLLHLKDLTNQPRMGTIKNDYATCPVGSGVIDWTGVLQAARQAGVVAGYVEQEPPFHPVYADLEKSRKYLAKLMA